VVKYDAYVNVGYAIRRIFLLHCLQTIYLMSSTNDGCDPVMCKVLDCDTITQAKEKALDAIYRNTPFSQRPSVHDLDLGKSLVALLDLFSCDC